MYFINDQMARLFRDSFYSCSHENDTDHSKQINPNPNPSLENHSKDDGTDGHQLASSLKDDTVPKKSRPISIMFTAIDQNSIQLELQLNKSNRNADQDEYAENTIQNADQDEYTQNKSPEHSPEITLENNKTQLNNLKSIELEPEPKLEPGLEPKPNLNSDAGQANASKSKSSIFHKISKGLKKNIGKNTEKKEWLMIKNIELKT
jgi:hypothetical protein